MIGCADDTADTRTSKMCAGHARAHASVLLLNCKSVCRCLEWDRVHEAFGRMQLGAERGGPAPDVVTYNIVIDAMGKARDPDTLLDTWDAMCESGVPPDVVRAQTKLLETFTSRSHILALQLLAHHHGVHA